MCLKALDSLIEQKAVSHIKWLLSSSGQEPYPSPVLAHDA